jgi:hypothetical protein
MIWEGVSFRHPSGYKGCPYYGGGSRRFGMIACNVRNTPANINPRRNALNTLTNALGSPDLTLTCLRKSR